MFAVFAAVSIVKRVTVVDEDIDPWDAVAVEWARTNRMRLERDLLLIPNAGADRSEPHGGRGTGDEGGVRCDGEGRRSAEGNERARPPSEVDPGREAVARGQSSAGRAPMAEMSAGVLW